MKDYYSSLHKFLLSHFPAQIHKLEAVKGNDVEVIKMYNMYKQLAKDKLQERQESADTENKSQEVAKGIHTAINNVDESLHYRDFAKAVAITLKENYGTHNIAPFMEVLHAGLGINEVKVENILSSNKKKKAKSALSIHLQAAKSEKNKEGENEIKKAREQIMNAKSEDELISILDDFGYDKDEINNILKEFYSK